MNLENYGVKTPLDPLVNPTSVAKASPEDVDYTLKPPKEQRESTFRDSWITLNPMGLSMYEPDLMYNPYETGYAHDFDYNDPEFKSEFEKASPETRKAMVFADNKSDAINIARRRRIFEESQKAISQDGLLTQLAMGVIPAMASPSSLLPAGSAMKAVQTAKYINRLNRLVKIGTVGAVTGAVANIADEAIFDVQGMPTSYMSAGLVGATFGGGLGLLSGALSGPRSAKLADSLDPANDSYTKDFDIDPSIRTVNEDGSIKITEMNVPKMQETILDKIGFWKTAFVSDIHKAYMSADSIIRKFMARGANPTISLRDADGNLIPIKNTAHDMQKIFDGYFSKFDNNFNNLYYEYSQKTSNPLSIDEFRLEVERVYTDEMTRQRNIVEAEIRDQLDSVVEDLETELKAKTDELKKQDSEWYYTDEEGNLQKTTPEMMEALLTGEVKSVENPLPEFPMEFGKATPRYYGKKLVFPDDITKAIYIAGGKGQQAGKYADWLTEVTGWDIGHIRDMRNDMLGNIKKQPRNIKEIKFDSYVPDELRTKSEVPVIDESTLTLVDKKSKEVQTEIAKLQEEYQAKVDEIADKIREDAYNSFEIDFSREGKIDPYFVKASEEIKKYTNKMHRDGKKFGLESFQKIPENQLYYPRMYDLDKIRNGEVSEVVAKQQIKDGIANDVRNQVKNKDGSYRPLTNEELDELTTEVYNKLRERSWDMHNMTVSFNSSDFGLGSRLKGRKLYLDESKLTDLLIKDPSVVMTSYHYGMRGTLGLQYGYGVDTPNKVMELLKKTAEEEGIDPLSLKQDDLDSLHRAVQDIYGTLRMNTLSNTKAWEWTRNLQTYNSLRLMGGAGANQVIELIGAVASTGVRELFNGRLGKSLKTTSDMLFSEIKKGDEFNEFMLNIGYMQDALHQHNINKFADVDVGLNPTFIEKVLTGMNEKFMKYNGMRYFVAVSEDFIGSTIVTRLKNGTASLEDIARWGLTKAEADNLTKALKGVISEEQWALSKLSKKNQALLQLAVSRGLDELIIQGNSLHLPNWMKAPPPVAKLMTQFMRFPMLANEILLRRGLTDDKARILSGAIASSVTFMMLKYVREQIAINMGLMDEADRQHDIFNDDEQLQNTFLQSLNYVGQLGMLYEAGINKPATFLGLAEPGRDWAQDSFAGTLTGPTASLVDDVSKTLVRAREDGITDERTLKKFTSLLPGYSLPIIKESWQYVAEEYGD